jgi:hypothetical protein
MKNSTPFRVLDEFEDNRTDERGYRTTLEQRLSYVRRERGPLPGRQHIFPLSWGDRETRFIHIEFYDAKEAKA